MDRQPYQLTLRFKFNCIDDIDAKESAEKLLNALGIKGIMLDTVDVIKLQKIHEGRPPEGLRFAHTKDIE